MTTQDITLQFAERSDAATLAAMSRDLIENGLGWRYRALSVRQLIDDPETVTLVARTAKRRRLRNHEVRRRARAPRAAGGAPGFPAARNRAAHHPMARRVGHDRRRRVHACGAARAQRGAHAFYRAIGFAETLRLPGYYSGRETAIRMMRMLRAPAGAER